VVNMEEYLNVDQEIKVTVVEEAVMTIVFSNNTITQISFLVIVRQVVMNLQARVMQKQCSTISLIRQS
jgi:hypothetical protein